MNLATGIFFDPELFFKEVARAAERALIVNYDGVLAPLLSGQGPSVSVPTVELMHMIVRACNTHVSLMTAGGARELDSILSIGSGLDIWGRHGFERLRADGSYERTPLDDHLSQLAEDAYQWLEAEGIIEFVERTPCGLRIDWRSVAEPAGSQVAAVAHRTLWPLEQHAQVELLRFPGGIELCCSERTADAVQECLAPLRTDAIVAYLGNCRNEERAFQLVRNRGVAVLVSEQFRPTAAQWWLPLQDVSRFLCQWIAACQEEAGGQKGRALATRRQAA